MANGAKGADIELVIGADVSASTERIESDINTIVAGINKNPPKIKFELNDTKIKTQLNAIKSQIAELNGKNIDIKVNSEFGNILKSSSDISSSLKETSINIQALSKSLENLGKNTNFSNITDGLNQATPVIESLKSELSSLQNAMQNFQGVNLNIGLGGGSAVTRNTVYGQSARQTISELKQQATQLENLLQTYYDVSDKSTALMKTIAGTNALQGKDIFSILNNVNNPKLSLSGQMDAWRQYISLIKSAASMKGIDISPVTSSFSNSADELISKTQKILTGEAELENGIGKLRNIFGSGINAEALNTQLAQINESINNVVNAINSIGVNNQSIEAFTGAVNNASQAISDLLVHLKSISEMKITIDDSSLQNMQQQIAGITNEIAKNQTGNISIDSKGIQQAASAVDELSSKTKNASKDAEILRKNIAELSEIKAVQSTIQSGYKKAYETLGGENATGSNLTQLETMRQKFIELTNETKKFSDNLGTSTQADANHIRTLQGEMQKLIQATQQNAQTAKQSADAQKRENDILAQRESLQKSANIAIVSGERALQRWSAAEHSSNAESREAYANLKSSVEELRNFNNQSNYSAESLQKLKSATLGFNSQLKDTEATLIKNGDASAKLSTKIGNLIDKFSSWFTVSQVIMYTIRSIREMISVSVELNSALTQMQVVTKASNSEMKAFSDSAAKTSKKVGSSITDFVSSATAYARLGQSMTDSVWMAEYTAKLQAIGDIDVSDAQNAVTSIIKAFDIDPGQIDKVMDKLIEVGNGFPISVEQIAEGMTNASSSLAAAGNTFEESVALLTAANTTIEICRVA